MAHMTTAQWQRLGAQIAQAVKQLPAGTRAETFSAVSVALAAEVALAAGVQAQHQGATADQIQHAIATTLQDALKSMTREAVKEGLLTPTDAAHLVDATVKAQPAVKAATKTATKVSTKVKPRVDPRAKPKADKGKPTKRKPTKRKPVRRATDKPDKDEAGRKKYPDGTIAWKQGRWWKIIPPPYDLDKPITADKPPAGVARMTGSPQETLTFLGGKLPFGDVSFDLGVVDGFIDVKGKRIRFAGGGLKTNVGRRIPKATKGISMPSTRAGFRTRKEGRYYVTSTPGSGRVALSRHRPGGRR